MKLKEFLETIDVGDFVIFNGSERIYAQCTKPGDRPAVHKDITSVPLRYHDSEIVCIETYIGPNNFTSLAIVIKCVDVCKDDLRLYKELAEVYKSQLDDIKKAHDDLNSKYKDLVDKYTDLFYKSCKQVSNEPNLETLTNIHGPQFDEYSAKLQKCNESEQPSSVG